MHLGYGSGNGVHGLNVAPVDSIRRRKSLQSLMNLLHQLHWRLLLRKYLLLRRLCSPQEVISRALPSLRCHEGQEDRSEHSEDMSSRLLKRELDITWPNTWS